MGVIIDPSKCIGCGKCGNVCPGNLIGTDEEGKAYLKKAKSCWSCASCMKECPVSAICLTLSVEMGGKGSKLYVSKDGRKIRWSVVKDNNTEKIITTNPEEANKY